MKSALAFLLCAALPWCLTCDEVTLLQTQKAVHSRMKDHEKKNMSSHVADPGISCPQEAGWQLATLDEGAAAGSYCIPPTDAYSQCIGFLLSGEVFELKTHLVLETHLRNAPAGDFLHGGLFVGDFLPHLSALAKPGARIYGFEPEPLFMKASRGTIGESSLPNVFTVQAGVSNETAVVPVVTQTEQVGQPLGNFLCVPVDDLLEPDRAVSLIFFDVEGYELLALQGAAKTLQRFHPIVVAATGQHTGDFSGNKYSKTTSESTAEVQASTEDVAAYLKTFGYEKFDEADDNVFFRVP